MECGASRSIARHVRVPPLFHCIQDLFQGNRSECCRIVRYPVRNDQLLTMDKTAARVNDIRHVSVALVYVELDQQFRQATNILCWVVKIQEERSDAVFSHRHYAVTDYEPPGLRFDGR